MGYNQTQYIPAPGEDMVDVIMHLATHGATVRISDVGRANVVEVV